MSVKQIQFAPWDRGIVLVYKMECENNKIYLRAEMSRGLVIDLRVSENRPFYPLIVLSYATISRDDGEGIGEADGFGLCIGQIFIGRGDLNLQALALLRPDDIARLYDPEHPFYFPISCTIGGSS